MSKNDQPPNRRVIEFDEDVAEAWAKLLLEAAVEHGAPNFAWHMAERGLTPANVRLMADSWEQEHYDPPNFAAHMRLFADDLQRCSGTEHSAWA